MSDKGDKTVVVNVERIFRHPLFKKTVRRSNHFHAHDEANKFKSGDLVRIQECAPKSKAETLGSDRRRLESLRIEKVAGASAAALSLTVSGL